MRNLGNKKVIWGGLESREYWVGESFVEREGASESLKMGGVFWGW